MVLRAVQVIAIDCHAWVLPEIVRMVLKLFPSMALVAVKSIWASVSVLYNLVDSVPSSALLRPVRILVWLATEILPVMSIDANLSLMVSLLVGTPSRLEVVHIEVGIAVKPLN